VKKRAHLHIYGRVQGVFFRAHMREEAKKHGVYGWVRNNPDGSVEAVLEGEFENVLKVVCWANRGPPAAKVEKLTVIWEEYKGEFSDFSIRY